MYSHWRIVLAVVAVLVVLCVLAPPRLRAQTNDDESPATRPTIDTLVKKLGEQHGVGAVSLQGYLLHHAIQAGSQLEASVAIVGLETHNGHEYFAYSLDTGIVYPKLEVSHAQQLSRLWSDVVDPTLRKAVHLRVPGEGLALRVRSYRGDFKTRLDIAEELRARRLIAVDTAFFLPFDAIRAFVDGKLGTDELSSRFEIEMDGATARLDISPTPPLSSKPTDQ